MESPVTVTAVVPKLMTPAPAAVTVPFTIFELGDVAVTPPVKLIVSLPSPSVRVPVLLKVTAFVIVLIAPVSETLYAPEAVVSVGVVSPPAKLTV